ncbi:hypothetical protein CA85_23050 [Allorhodopirellula solitaria]|uniref:Uncharacterized protein n=1 Tax=Allorhodopirellula solitaria TaxID=2527987 RepID=A0A5C5XX50_9BACT|nr:hypothetical protein CA85_23050 [Allorhodopirellula solitaria]
MSGSEKPGLKLEKMGKAGAAAEVLASAGNERVVMQPGCQNRHLATSKGRKSLRNNHLETFV